jgi:hypothetical protein
MAKQDAYLIVGLPHAGVPVLSTALEAHRDALAEVGVRVPARSSEEAFRAAVELRREHKAWALRRKDVEGTWAGICRRALKTRDTVVVGHELLAGAAPDEIDLLVDGLAGTRVHVVVVVASPDPLVGLVPSERDFADVVGRWARATRAPERVHVLLGDQGPARSWHELGELVGFDADALPLPAGVDADAGRLDVHTLGLLAESTAALLDDDELEELVGHWAKTAADGGYDVRGDLSALGPRPATTDVPLTALRAALAETVAEVGRLRERVAELEVSAAARRPRLRSSR